MDTGENTARVVVRPARAGDADDLAVAHVRAWQVAYSGLMSAQYLDRMEVAERAQAWAQRLAQPAADSRVVVADVRDRVVGFVVFGRGRDGNHEAGEVYSLNVHPDHWQVGVGGELLSATHAGLAELGFSGAFLWVIEGNRRARDFYERRGWTRDEDQRIRDIQGVSVDEVRYSRSLAG
ncbi:MAG: hypothetical protein QOG52_196 [Frankiaceae bacterium]|nr:hypothetical protein [Frankiaceae bacterium]